jgi:demethylmenaquinone methyltransferase/2-methoxy-6-polyprenyl-1,4-benzoquinol methylase
MLLNAEEVRRLYRRTARFYDAAVWMYRLAGVHHHRQLAVAALALRPGDTVVDMACGTGLNLGLLHAAVGPAGRIVGVDLSDAMLERARARGADAGWENVELVEANLSEYTFPQDLDGALATFALEMVPEYDAVVRRTGESLPRGGRLALLGLRYPERWPH